MVDQKHISQQQKLKPASSTEENWSGSDAISTLMPPDFSIQTLPHGPTGMVQMYSYGKSMEKAPFKINDERLTKPQPLQTNNPIQASFWESVGNFAEGIGSGIYSVGEDLVGGAYRTARGLNVFDENELSRIGAENERAYLLISNIFENRNLLADIVRYTMQDIYNHLPPEQQQQIRARLQSATETGAGYVVGRLIIGSTIARAIATRIAARIAASQAYRMVATRLGLSAGAGATGIGIPITLLMVQGVLERAGQASRRLQSNYPELYGELHGHEIEMGWFLVEPHFEEIRRELIASQ